LKMTLYDFLDKAQGRMVRDFNKALGLRPVSDPYVSGDSLRALADHCFEEGERFNATLVSEGDVVFVKSDKLPRFFESILPQIRSRFVLISHNSDQNVDDTLLRFADDEHIGHWFAQNLVAAHPKVEAIPIGLENRWLHANGTTVDFDRLRAHPVTKDKWILYAFSLGTNPAERGPALEALKSCLLADGPRWTISAKYRETLASYRFVASPPGNGFDCHRTWEALYLGTIPIVKRAAFFDAFPKLPALFVDDWKEAMDWDKEFLLQAYDRLSSKIGSCPYLWMDYWKGKIEEQRKASRRPQE